MRQAMEEHRQNAVRRLPQDHGSVGFAMENFDAVGCGA
jgi:hypothetical protein